MNKEKLPHSQSALVLGILSIVTACCCWGILGVILGLIGLSNANKAIKIHNENPDLYDGINNANTGRTTAIIGIVLGSLIGLYMVYIVSTGDYQMMMEQYQEMLLEQTN